MFVANAAPPDDKAYQLISYPEAAASTVNAGVAVPSQITGLFGFVGGLIVGHAQFGALTVSVVTQTLLVAVIVMSVPAVIPVIVDPDTVPLVVVIVPIVDVKVAV